MKPMIKLCAAGTLFAAGMMTLTAHAQVVGIATGQQGSLGYKTGQAVAKVINLKAKLTARSQPMAGTGNIKGKPNPNLRMVDVTLISLGSGAGRKVNAKLRGRGGIRYVSLDKSPAAEARFQKLLPAAKIITMKANAKLPGLTEPTTNIVEIPWVMVTHKDAPADLVYKVTKAIAEHNKDLGASFDAFKRDKVSMMAPKHAVPYYPGAIKYYKEANVPMNR